MRPDADAQPDETQGDERPAGSEQAVVAEHAAMDAVVDSSQESSRLLTFGGWGKVMVLFWAIQILFFTTFFTNVTDGLATGIVGSLGYWLAQQEVARGGQPWYYYYMLGGLYEFLPIVLSAVGIVGDGLLASARRRLGSRLVQRSARSCRPRGR